MVLYLELSVAFEKDYDDNLSLLSDLIGIDADLAITRGVVGLQLVNEIQLLSTFDTLKNMIPLTNVTHSGITLKVPRTVGDQQNGVMGSVFLPWSNVACMIDLSCFK